MTHNLNITRIVQVGSTSSENPTWTILDNVSCVTTHNFTMLEIGDFFGINTDLQIDPNSIPHTDETFSDPTWTFPGNAIILAAQIIIFKKLYNLSKVSEDWCRPGTGTTTPLCF